MQTGSKRRQGRRLVAPAAFECLESRMLLTNTAPVLDTIGNVTMVSAANTNQLAKTHQVPLTASDADGDVLTYTVTSSNTDIVPILHNGNPYLKMTVQFGAGVSEVQTLKGTAAATAGTFTLSFNGNTTTALAFNATVATVQTALRLLPGLESVVVGGSALTSTSGMTFTIPAASGNIGAITVDATALTPSTNFTVTETVRGILPGATGEMQLMLFKDWAPQTVAIISGLVNAGFYDNLTFHRILKGFMAQGGDPLGTGSGGPGFQFDDEYNPNLIFSNRGQLAMANSGDDTNGSQFFITDVATRHLDFNHTIFGQLVRGFETLDGLVNSPVTDSSTGAPTPTGSVKIVSASIVPNTTDNVLTLQARKPVSSAATITVVVKDGKGGSVTRTFTVTATADTSNTPAYLKPLTDLYTPMNQPISIPLSGVDLERDALAFDGIISDETPHATLIKNGARFIVVPDKGYTGVIHLLVGANRTVNRTGETDTFDKQTITISVGGKPIHVRPVGYSAIANIERTGYVATFTCDDAALDAGSFTATINWGDGTSSTNGTIVKSGSLYLVTGTHKYVKPGDYPLAVTITRSTLALQTGAVATVTNTAQVAPAAPDEQTRRTIINPGGPLVARLNVACQQYASVSSTSSTLSGKVNWGDGSALENLAINANGNFRLLHTYKKTGKFTITITVNDGSGTAVVKTLAATVLAAGPKVTVSGDKSGITGQNRTLYLRPSDAGANLPAGNYSYSINWGDGSPVQTTTDGSAAVGHCFWKTGTFNVTVRAIDRFGSAGPVTTYPVTISNAMLQADPFNTQSKALVIGGTQGNDKISVGIGKKGIAVTVNGKSIGEFLPTGFLYLWGYEGNDTIAVNKALTSIVSIYGGPGNDVLTGGGGFTVLVGGDGNDTLKGSTARSILIGGNGADKLTGQGDDDVLVGPRSVWDNEPAYLIYLLAEQVQGTAYATRVGHLNGTLTGGQNGGITLEYRTVNSALQQTVYDDAVIDTLTGGGGNDWFVANQTGVVADAGKKDSITDKTSTEQLLEVLT